MTHSEIALCRTGLLRSDAHRRRQEPLLLPPSHFSSRACAHSVSPYWWLPDALEFSSQGFPILSLFYFVLKGPERQREFINESKAA